MEYFLTIWGFFIIKPTITLVNQIEITKTYDIFKCEFVQNLFKTTKFK